VSGVSFAGERDVLRGVAVGAGVDVGFALKCALTASGDFYLQPFSKSRGDPLQR